MKNKPHAHATDHRQRAQFGLSHGDLLLAQRSYESILEMQPEDPEALQQLANIHLGRREMGRAAELLAVAVRVQPSDAMTWHRLGTALMDSGDAEGAMAALRRALELAPKLFLARLRLSILLDQAGRPDEALVACFGAVSTAQSQGRWLDDETTAPDLRLVVKRAMQYVNLGRRALFDGVLRPLHERYGRSEMTRVEQCLSIYLGEQPALLPDPRQRPKFLYFPGVPSQPYYPRERFPWQAGLEAATSMIRDELLHVLDQSRDLEPFLQTDSPQDTADLLRSSSENAAAWEAYFFHRHGERYDAHCAACPGTAAILDTLPLPYVREHSPETLYSVLRPGTHILPHRGVTNTRLVTHLPLIVPADCALRVGGETHAWQEGRCVTFDDTFEHEAWNHSDQTRVVLIVDTWNPDLSEAERAAVSDLVGAIGDFNRECEVPTPKG